MLQLTIDKSQELQSELIKTIEEIEMGLEKAKEVMDTANDLGINLVDEQGNIGGWAKDCLAYGFDEYDEDEAEKLEECLEDIFEYANQIEYIFSEKYRKLSRIYNEILDI